MAICASFSLRAAAACAFSRTLCCRPVPAIELSSCRPELSAPAWKEYARKNPQEAILDRPAQGCRKKRIHRRNGGHGIGRGHSAPTRSRLSERSVSIAGAASRESPPFLLFQPEQPLWVLQRNQNRHPQFRTRFRRLRPHPAEQRHPPAIHPARLLDPQHSVSQPVNPQTIPLEPARESAAFSFTFANESARACSLFEIV